MADRYLLESGAPDGYLLEDGSGVLILDCNDGFQFDSFQSPGFQSCPYTTTAFDAANGFPWNQDAGESFVASQVFADPTTDLLYAFGPPLNAVQRQAFYAADDDGVVQSYPVPDDSIQAWAVQPPLNAVADQSWNLDDGERFVASQVIPDTTEVVAGYVPPTLQAWPVDGGEVQARPDDDPSVQSWAVGPPPNAVIAQAFNTPDEARTEAVDDSSVQSYAIQPPAVTTVTQLTAFTVDTEDEVQAPTTQDDTPQAWSITPPQNAVAALVFNQPQDEPYTTVEDPTVPTYAIQPPPYIPVFQVTAWPVDGGEVQSAPTPDDSVQSWAVGTPQNAIALVAFNGDSEVTQAAPVDDPSAQSWAVQPLFDPSTVTWTARDDIVQPVWAIADDSAQAWTIVPPVPFIGNIADESVIPAWMIPDDTTLGAWAATNGAVTVVTGGPGPNSGGATASMPSGSAFVPVPGGSAISPVPSGSASSPTPQR